MPDNDPQIDARFVGRSPTRRGTGIFRKGNEEMELAALGTRLQYEPSFEKLMARGASILFAFSQK